MFKGIYLYFSFILIFAVIFVGLISSRSGKPTSRHPQPRAVPRPPRLNTC